MVLQGVSDGELLFVFDYRSGDVDATFRADVCEPSICRKRR